MKNSMTKLSYVYILKCNDGSLYTGYTVDLCSRVIKHNTGKGAKYTRGRAPVKLVYVESFSNKIDAQKREYRIKQLNRKQKITLIESKNLTS